MSGPPRLRLGFDARQRELPSVYPGGVIPNLVAPGDWARWLGQFRPGRRARLGRGVRRALGALAARVASRTGRHLPVPGLRPMPEFSAVPFFRQIPPAMVDERLEVGLVDTIAAGGDAWIYPVGLGAYRGAWWGDGARPGEPRLLERIPTSTLARLRAPNAYLLLDFSEEALSTDPAGWTAGLLGYLLAAAPPLGLSPRRILVLVGSLAPVPAEAIGGIRVINHAYALVQAGFAYRTLRADPERFVQAAAVEAELARRELRPKRFLCLNGTLRLHRLCVVLHLLRSGHLDRGLVSFPECAPELLGRLHSTGAGELASTRPPVSDLLRTPPTDLLRRLPLTVDRRLL